MDNDKPVVLDYQSKRPRLQRWDKILNWALAIVISLLIFGVIAVVVTLMNERPVRSNRVHCASNLRQIGQGIALYANDHSGLYPARLDQLLTDADVSPEVMNCPSSHETPAKGPTSRAIVADFAQQAHCSYVYVGAGMRDKTAKPETIVAYEGLSHHEDGANFLYGDGHVDWLDKAEAQRVLNELAAGFNPPRAAK